MRVERRVLGAIAIGAAMWIAALAILLPSRWFLARRFERAATAMGLALEFRESRIGWDGVILEDVRFGFAEGESIRGAAKKVRIPWRRHAIDADSVEVTCEGTKLNVLLALAQWVTAHPAAISGPISAKNVDVSGMDVPVGDLVATENGGLYVERATHAEFASWKRRPDGVEIAVGQRAAPRVRMDVSFASQQTTLEIAPMPLRDFAYDIGFAARDEKIHVAGRAVLPRRETDDTPVIAHVEGHLDGIDIRPPIELDALSFGTAGSFSADVEVGKDIEVRRGRLVLGESELYVAGPLTKGAGFGLGMHGTVPCRVVAEAARAAAPASTLRAIWNRPSSKHRSDGWLPVSGGFWFDHLNRNPGLDDSRNTHFSVGSDCGVVPIARLDPTVRDTLTPRVRDRVEPGRCWPLNEGRDYPGFMFSDNACLPAVEPPKPFRNPPTAVIEPGERTGFVGERVTFTVTVKKSRTDWKPSCAGPAEVDRSDAPILPGEPRRIVAMVEPWPSAPDQGLILSTSARQAISSINVALPIAPRDYELLAPVRVETEAGVEMKPRELRVSRDPTELTVSFADRGDARASLIRSEGANLMYVGVPERRRYSEEGDPRAPKYPVTRLSFPSSVPRPIRVLVVAYKRSCQIDTLETTIE